MPRILLVGASSTGKTTLAREIEAKLGIPFVSVQTGDLMRECGVHSHPDLLRRTPEFQAEFQLRLALDRLSLMRQHENCVMDRSPLDAYVYYLLGPAAHLNAEQGDLLVDAMRQALQLSDLSVYYKFGSIPLSANDLRSTNPHFHQATCALYGHLLSQLTMDARRPYRTSRVSKLEHRLAEIVAYLTPADPCCAEAS